MSSLNRTLSALRNLALAAATGSIAVATNAQAQSQPLGTGANDPKPIVMLLVDSSGSMERLPNTDVRVDALPDCSTNERNRWSVTLESLTGTFNNFGCTEEDRSAYAASEYDYGYFLPHYRPTYTSQTPTGILDTYAERAKFGLMTFDPVGTYVSGPFFVPYATLSGDPNNATASGMYSYGEVRELAFPGCTTVYGVDNGVRNDAAPSGRLIAPETTEDSPNVALVNQQIQQALLGSAPLYADAVRPFGGTPVAGMLDDLEYFFDNDATHAVGSDPYASCRPRLAILITDGLPDSDFRDPRFDCDIGTTSDQDADDPSADPTCAAAGAGGCRCPYDLPAEYIARMCTKDSEGNCTDDSILNMGFHVVALSLAADDEAVEELNALAEEGGTEQAYLADNAASLDSALSEILDTSAREATTRVTPVVRVDAVGQISELTTGFSIPDDGSAWNGVIQRQRYECQNEGGTLQPTAVEMTNDDEAKDLLHQYLDEQSLLDLNLTVLAVDQADAYKPIKGPYVDSDVYTRGTILNRNGITNPLGHDSSWDSTIPDLVADATLAVTDVTETTLTAVTGLTTELLGALGLSSGGGLLGGLVNPLLGGMSDLNGDGSIDGSDASEAYAWLAGEPSSGRQSRLGAIYHSQPVVVAPPTIDSSNDALNTFYTALQDQPEVVIVATADGLLRAFSLEHTTFDEIDNSDDSLTDLASAFGLTPDDLAVEGSEPGDQLWAIAPPAALATVPDAVTGTQLLFDGSPIVRTIATDRAANTDDASSYRRILIAALRGLPVFVAFDITNVTKPKFMWQFAHPGLGQTTGQPIVTQLAVQWNDDAPYERSIALFPGGAGEETTVCDAGGVAGSGRNGGDFPTGADRRLATNPGAFRCWREKGRYLYAVDVMTGSVVQAFDHNHFAAPLTGALAVDVSDLGLSATAAYITDEEGILYRVDFRDPAPENWKVDAIFDVFHEDPGTGTNYGGRPVTYPPLVRTSDDGKLNIVLATGDLDNLTDGMPHRIVSISDEIDYDVSATSAVRVEENWSIMLEPRESVTGELLFLEDTVYFTSFVANIDPSDMCSVGASRVWGVDLTETDENGDPLGKLPHPDDSITTLLTHVDHTYPDYAYLENNLLVGLSIVQQPVCLDEAYDGMDSFLGNRYVPTSPPSEDSGKYTLRAVSNGGAGEKATGSSFNQVDIEMAQPSNLARLLTGGYGSVLE